MRSFDLSLVFPTLAAFQLSRKTRVTMESLKMSQRDSALYGNDIKF